MTTNSSVGIERYCREVVESVIGASASDAEKARAHYSPNNVRRLFLSPDGVSVQFFTTNQLKSKAFEPDKYMRCVSHPKYKPVIGVLAGMGAGNVCSNIEEIIICMRSGRQSQGVSLSLNQLEADYTNLLDTSRIGNKDIKSAIMQRFGRLRSVMYFDGCLGDFIRSYAQKGASLTYTYADDDSVRRLACSVHDFNTKDWYMSISLRPQYYQADMPDGLLSRKLNNTKEYFLKLKKDSAVDDAKQAYLGELVDKWEKAVSDFEPVFYALTGLYSVCAGNRGTFYYASGVDMQKLLHTLAQFKFYDLEKALSRNTKLVSVFKKLGISFTPAESLGADRKNQFLVATQELRRASALIYVELINEFARVIKNMQDKYPYVTSVLLSEYSNGIQLPPQGVSLDLANVLQEVYRGRVQGVSIKASLVEICMFMSCLLVSESVVIKNNLFERDYWLTLVASKGVA